MEVKIKVMKPFRTEIDTKIIPEELTNKEEELYKVKWFDYRVLTPTHATYLFFEIYLMVYREYYARNFDVEEAVNAIPGFCNEDGSLTDATKILFWSARQSADSIGCKYEYFIRTAFRRVCDFGWHYLPAPEQLSCEESVKDVSHSWEEWKRHSLQLATSSWFTSSKYCGTPEQISYYDYLVEQVKIRRQSEMVLSRLIEDKNIPLSVVVKYFTEQEVSKAMSFIVNK